MKLENGLWFLEIGDAAKPSFAESSKLEPEWTGAKYRTYSMFRYLHWTVEKMRELLKAKNGFGWYDYSLAGKVSKGEVAHILGERRLGDLLFMLRSGFITGPHPQELSDSATVIVSYDITERGLAEMIKIKEMPRREQSRLIMSFMHNPFKKNS